MKVDVLLHQSYFITRILLGFSPHLVCCFSVRVQTQAAVLRVKKEFKLNLKKKQPYFH